MSTSTQTKIDVMFDLASRDLLAHVAGRPTLLSYSGVRVDLDDDLWGLYLRAGEDSAARTMLYEKAGAGGWDDECRDCTDSRYDHKGNDHPFISEEQ